MKKVRLSILDEHAAVRTALETRLGSSHAIEVIRTVEDPAVDQLCPESGSPDVVLFGLRSSNSLGLEPAINAVARLASKGIQVIVLASYADDMQRELLLKAGARRYLLKDINSDQLIDAILSLA